MEKKVMVLPNGPVMIEGPVKITLMDGSIEAREGSAYLCRCGHSEKKPFCDGSHKKKNFVG